MPIKPEGEPKKAIERWMVAWFDLLGDGHLAEACALIDLPAGNGRAWTPEMLVSTIRDSFGSGTRFRDEHPGGPVFTPASTARGTAHASVVPYSDGTGFAADYDVPLNGSFSDLTAQFVVRWVGQELHVLLYDLHVM